MFAHRVIDDALICVDTHQGVTTVSDLAVTFHYVTPNMMYDLEYFLYRLRLHGVRRAPPVTQLHLPWRRTLSSHRLNERMLYNENLSQ